MEADALVFTLNSSSNSVIHQMRKFSAPKRLCHSYEKKKCKGFPLTWHVMILYSSCDSKFGFFVCREYLSKKNRSEYLNNRYYQLPTSYASVTPATKLWLLHVVSSVMLTQKKIFVVTHILPTALTSLMTSQ